MNIDPNMKSARFIMLAIEHRIVALQMICDNPASSENDIADASNDIIVYRAVLDEMNAELNFDGAQEPAWVTKGKSITQLIQELSSFEDQSLEVRLMFNGGETHKPISILTRRDGYAMIEYCGL